MSDYTVAKVEDIPDISGDYPGEMRMGAPGAEQVAFTWRRMEPQTGGKGAYGHHHFKQEEIYFVIEGTLQFKCDDDVFDAGPGTVVTMPPHVVRSTWNEGPDDVVLLMLSQTIDDVGSDVEKIEGFWPAYPRPARPTPTRSCPAAST